MATVETIDNTDTAGEAVTSQVYSLDVADSSTVVEWVSSHDNGFDVGVSVTARLTTDDDESMSKFVTDASVAESEAIASGSTLGIEDDRAWSYVQFEVTPDADPTTGEYTITFQKRRK